MMHSTAPAASARVRIVASSVEPPSCPTLARSAITSTPGLSLIDGTGRGVSSPTVYANSTRLGIRSSCCCCRVSQTGQFAEALRHLGAARSFRHHDEDRVVAGDRSDDAAHPRTVYGRPDD